MKSVKYWILLILFASLPSAQSSVGGERVSSADWPYAVQISLRGGSQCSGVIVNDQTVLTAGHCLFESGTNRKMMTLSFRSKTVDRFLFWKIPGFSRTQKSFQISKIYGHPKYTGRMAQSASSRDVEADLVVLKIWSGGLLEFIGVKEPLLIGDLKSHPQDLLATVSFGGSGGAQSRGGELGGEMKKINLVPLGFVSPGVFTVTSQAPGDGLCKGDSGGGLFGFENDRPVLLGILSGVSQDSLCGQGRLKAYFVDVSKGVCEISAHHKVVFEFAAFCK